MHTQLFSSIISSPNINGKSMIKFHNSHAVSFSLKFDPYIILIGCCLMALPGFDCLKKALLMLIFCNVIHFFLIRTHKWNFQGYLSKSMWKSQGSVNKEAEFCGMLKKNSCGFSMGLGFWPYNFQGVSYNFSKFPVVKACLLRNLNLK